ncbi:EAL domain-containing protein [Hyphobacterium sp.]|uniref:EAL domain-containing protein n=1 Tax=Hyphobacterium sp. TaxID=2004662 RepID=UPI003B52EF2B
MTLRQYALLLMVFLLTLPVSGAWAQSENAIIQPFAAAVEESRSSMMRDPAAALAQAQRAERMVPVSLDGSLEATALATTSWLQAEALTRLGRPDEARPIAERALELLGEDPAPTKLYADILLSVGRTLKLGGEHGRALDFFQSAYDVYVEIDEPRSQAIVLQSIGSIYNDARQYQRAIEYFEDATERYHDTSLDLAAFNNLGNAYTALSEFEPALSNYELALEIAAEMQSPMLEARILNNIASMHIAAEEWTAADNAITRAFNVAGNPDGAEWARFLYGVRAQAALGRGEFQAARSHIERVFDGVPITETNHHFTDFHETAAQLYRAIGQPGLALEHFEAYKRLDDDGREFAASANSALVGAQFDFAAQELEIEQLRAVGLERDLALAQSESRQRTIIAIGVGAITLVLLFGAILVIRGFRLRNQMMKDMLFVDAETGLPTRHSLVKARNRSIEFGGSEVFFAAIRLDRASSFETLLGFATFVKVQSKLGERLATAEGITEVGLIGPGVFGVILDTDDSLLLEHDIKDLVDLVSRPMTIDGVELDIGLTVGLANDRQSEIAVRNAIIALSQADENQAMMATFNERQLGDPTENLSLMTRMRSAMASGDIELHFQPKLDLRSGGINSAEALCRWNDPERGYIPPDAFIPQAEETGKIRELTEWSIREAIKQKAYLAEHGHDIEIAVNISGRLITDASFGARVLDILGYGGTGLTFEITETAMMHKPETAMHNLDRWVDAGCKIAIDDYGTGFSSLAYLKRLPCHELKLDKTFISGAQTSSKDRTLIKSTVDLAHNLGMTLTAEGVEDEVVLAALKAMGCDHAQGYVISRATNRDELLRYLGSLEAEDIGGASAGWNARGSTGS